MKKMVVLAVLFGITVMIFAQTAISLDQAVDNCANHLRNQLPKGARVAIFKIEARADGLAEQVTDSLSAKIVAQNHLTVIERGRILRILETEQLYQMSGNVSNETAAALGKQLGAELIIAGSIIPRGDYYSMNVRVVQVETARIQTQWSANTVRLDWNMPMLTATVRFAGTALDTDDQDMLAQDLQRALGKYQIPITTVYGDETADANYHFLITFRVNRRSTMLAADLSIAFRQGNRTLKQSERHTYTEMDMEFLVRKGGELINQDQAFFQSLPGILAQQ
jgi:TolB-like protein